MRLAYLKFKRIVILAAIAAVIFPKLAFAVETDLKLYDSKVEFEHFKYELNPDYTMKSADTKSLTKTEFITKIIENKYLKVTLLPEFGGRILSIIYKPTGHELLYQNPIGTPYGIGEDNFYYNWLMVYGGIFPTFPEPEHGKTWCLPWKSRIVEQSEEKLAFEMSFTDDISPVKGVPGKFNKGKTGITCIQTVTLYKDKSYVDYNIKLINNRNSSVKYEYWTCTTLAPGSEPGNTFSPENSEIIAPIDKVKLKDDWWSWMGKAEKPIDQHSHIFEFKNLAFLKNWEDMGIAYASPAIDKNWWGVINLENKEGILRIADNKQHTPGLKFWTWGNEKGRKTDPGSFGDAARPYIELWAGNSTEFFSDAKIPPKEQKTWNEYYIPTVGLEKITYANRHGAVYMNYVKDRAKNEITFNADIFSTHPDETLKLTLELKGEKTLKILESDFKNDPVKAKMISVPITENSISDGSNLYEMTLATTSGEVLIKADTPFVDTPGKHTTSGDLPKSASGIKEINPTVVMTSIGLTLAVISIVVSVLTRKE